MNNNSFLVEEEGEGMRLDLFLAHHLSHELSRTKIKECIKSGGVTVNGVSLKTAHHKLRANDTVGITYEEPRALHLEAQDIPLDIVYEDARIVIINKPVGLVVHPGAGMTKNTLVNALLAHIERLSTQGGVIRPGIVHRIDKNTSGLLVVAKSDQVHMRLAEQFKDHSITRRYYAVVKGVVQHDEGKCDASIGAGKVFKKKMVVEGAEGRHAVTYFKVIERFSKATLLDIRLETGRTHQIRVHMAHMGYPILGDTTYGVQSRLIKRQALHAYVLGFMHPVTNKYVEFTADLPDDMKALIEKLRAE